MPKLFTLTNLMVKGARLPISKTPDEVGLAYEEVAFPSTDGTPLAGWFLPAHEGPGPSVVFSHGWLWNRHGNVAGRVPFTDRDVEFLPAAKALHDAGFHVLLFEHANHGSSGKRFPLTFGVWEGRDVAGAVRYLRTRPEVDPLRIGAIGTSAGANAVLYGEAEARPLKAAIAVQPTRVAVFNRNFARDVLGWFGPMAAASTNLLYFFVRAPLPRKHDPAVPAARMDGTVVQYVQGTGDPWGEMGIVHAISDATPGSVGVIEYPSTGRYEGYQYVQKETGAIVDFFVKHL